MYEKRTASIHKLKVCLTIRCALRPVNYGNDHGKAFQLPQSYRIHKL